MTVDIICSVLDGARYLEEFLASLRAQTHTEWHLWVRDDGSTDATVAIVTAAAAADPRITLLHRGGPQLGVAGGFGWLLERVPADSAYVMCGDADDVWLPHKIGRTLAAMLKAEARLPVPTLVHTDLTVVDAHLNAIHKSFWRYSGIDPSRNSLRALIVRNVATAPTVMINRALRELIGATPPEATYQDWWYACVAAAFGRVVAVPESTVLYRQHGANVVGARAGAPVSLRDFPRAAAHALRNTALLREHLAQSAAQAGAFLTRYNDTLIDVDREFLADYAQLPHHPFLRRKLEVIRLRLRPEQGILRNLGVLFRA